MTTIPTIETAGHKEAQATHDMARAIYLGGIKGTTVTVRCKSFADVTELIKKVTALANTEGLSVKHSYTELALQSSKTRKIPYKVWLVEVHYSDN